MASTLTRAASSGVHDTAPGGRRWETWLLRAVLVGSVVYALVRGQPGGAIVAAIALALSWLPRVLRTPTPRAMESVWVFALALPATSDALNIYDHVTHWGKLVHGLEGGLAAALAAWLVLGFRDRRGLDLPTQLAALTSLFVGITAGAVWEIVEFLVDWVRASDLQKSNTDTMTDMLWADLAAGCVALLAVRLYYHAFSSAEQAASGAVAERLFTPIGRLLDRHGKLMLVVAVLIIAAFIASLWFTGRPVPGLPID